MNTEQGYRVWRSEAGRYRWYCERCERTVAGCRTSLEAGNEARKHMANEHGIGL